MNNCMNIVNAGVSEALTGPVDRNDIGTVKNHISVLSEEEKRAYIVLSEAIVKLAEIRNPDRDYEELKGFLEGER